MFSPYNFRLLEYSSWSVELCGSHLVSGRYVVEFARHVFDSSLFSFPIGFTFMTSHFLAE